MQHLRKPRLTPRLRAKHVLSAVFLLGILQFLWLSADWLFRDDVTDDTIHAEMAKIVSGFRFENRKSFKEKHPFLADKEWLAALNDPCDTSSDDVTPEVAKLETSPGELFSQMGSQWQWEWIQGRIDKLWTEWLEAGRVINETLSTKRTKKRILVIPGFLTLTDFASPKVIRDGGPLGELVTWSDLIAVLTLLGHDVAVEYSVLKASHLLRWLSCKCSGGCCRSGFDLIYTDYGGMGTMPTDVLQAVRYKLRVLDWFGTDAVFNDVTYARDHGYGTKSAFSLHLEQYLTGYPVSTDNSFLGFAVPKSKLTDVPKKNVGVLYGKDINYAMGKDDYLRQLSRHITLHSTMARSRHKFPDDLIIANHGIMTPEDYTEVTSSAKVLVGLGHPLEGPSPVEALARGTIFLNPKFTKSEDRNALHRKPTVRQVSSQVPYLEEYIGSPHVLTFDVFNPTEVEAAIKQALNTQVSPFIPYEFKMAGYLERLNYYISYQDFCHPQPHPALAKALRVLEAHPEQSCAARCKEKGLLCEHSLFKEVNTKEAFIRMGVNCRFVSHGADVIHPSYVTANQTCYLQNNTMLFSCGATSQETHMLCPCRDFKHFQHALCKECGEGPR